MPRIRILVLQSIVAAAVATACGGPHPPGPTTPTSTPPAASTFSDAERVAILGHLLATGLEALDLIETPPTVVPQSTAALQHSINCPSYTITTVWGFPFSGEVRTSCEGVLVDGQITLKETITTVAAPDIFTSCMPDAFCTNTQVYYFPQGRIDISGQVRPAGRAPNGRMSWTGALEVTGSLLVGKSPTSPITIALDQVHAQLVNFPNQSGGQISGSFLSSGSSPLPLAAPLSRAGSNQDLIPGAYQLIAIDGTPPPKDIGLLDIFPPAGGCDLTIDGGTLNIGTGALGANGYDLEISGRRTNCTDGSGKPFAGAALSGGEGGTWSLSAGKLSFVNVPSPEYSIDAAGFSGGMIVLGVTAWPHSNGGPFHLILAFART